MSINISRTLLVVVGCLVTAVPPTTAQDLATLGSRAAALTAFVAVADDASAVAWNPAGLVSGPFVNIQVGFGRASDDRAAPFARAASATRGSATLVSLGTTPAGLAYYRLATSFAVADPAVVGSPDREHNRVLIRTLVTNHFGATVQQSLGSFLTLGATVKLVHGSAGSTSAAVATWDEALDRASTVERDGKTRGDVDLGAMVAAGRVRAGLVVRNLLEPTFGADDGGQMTLARHVRAGVAWANGWPGLSQTIVAVDADLTRVRHGARERRDVAAGVERWLKGQRVGVRGGVRASTLGEARVVASAGGSYAVRPGLFLDGVVARGRRADRAWSISARVAY